MKKTYKLLEIKRRDIRVVSIIRGLSENSRDSRSVSHSVRRWLMKQIDNWHCRAWCAIMPHLWPKPRTHSLHR